MNKSYKTIWNESLGAWVAASELATGRGKSSRSRKVARAVLAAGMLLQVGVMAPSVAVAGGMDGGTVTNKTQIAYGPNANVANNGPAIAIGNNATVSQIGGQGSANGAIAIGFDVHNSSSSSILMGSEITTDDTVGGSVIFQPGGTGNPNISPVSKSQDSFVFIMNGRNTVTNSPEGVAIGGTLTNAGGGIAIGPASMATATGGLAMGQSAQALGLWTISLGRDSKASNAQGVAVGAQSSASGAQSVAVGMNSKASNTSALAAGNAANAAGSSAVAVGSNTLASLANTVAVGNNAAATGANAISVGNASAASGSDATAAGPSATASGGQSVAVGLNAKATNTNAVATGNSVALGNDSTTSAAVASTGVTLKGNTYTFAGGAPVGVVSVGSAGQERQITNVAAGQLNADSTDAVNGSQLYATNQALNNIQGGGGIMYFHANSKAGDSSADGAESVAIGPQAVSKGDGSVAMGNGAKSNAANSVALGAGSTADRTGMAGQKELFSNTVVNSTQGAVSVGSAGNERQITNVAGGTEATDAVNVRQLQAVKAGSVQYDTHADGSVNQSSITLGGSGGSATAIHNVAAGVAGTDAANVDQVKQMGRDANAYTDQTAGQMRTDMRNNARDASAGTAGAMAMAGMPQASIPGKSMWTAGVAGYDGQAAVAIGVSKLADNGRWVIKFSGSANSRGKTGVSVGAGFHW